MPLLPPISLDLMEAYTTLRPLALAIIGMASTASSCSTSIAS